ncbi:AMP-binding protein [Actinomadura luteofluorescens]|uniref:AMP-binding protein n=1 Tax=Actinomadura luteofluorescens TaxID=46163 RepID=UPI003635D101
MVNSSGRVFAEPRISAARRPDGTVLLSSRVPLEPYDADLARPLLRWAAERPGAVLAAERRSGGWDELTYGAALADAEALGEALLERGLGPDRPLMVLSGNSLRHLRLTLAGYLAGIPVVSLSTAYSLSGGHERLRTVTGIARPGAVYAEDGREYGAALAALAGLAPRTLVGREGGGEPSTGCCAPRRGSGSPRPGPRSPRTPSPRSSSRAARPGARRPSRTPTGCCAPSSR